MAPDKINSFVYVSTLKIFSSAEPNDSKKFQDINAEFMGNLGNIAMESAYSGNYSVKTDSDNPYAFSTTELKFSPGSVVIVKVMAKGDPGIMRIVASAISSADFYISSGPFSKSNEQQWHELKLRLEVTDTLSELPLKFYAYNSEKGTVYFDNFELEVITPVK